MSTGIVVCSVCNRELHQDGNKHLENGWRHCEDGKPRCVGARMVYPKSTSEIVGKWCGKDSEGQAATRRHYTEAQAGAAVDRIIDRVMQKKAGEK